MNDADLEFLMLIPSTEPFTFNELCNALGDDCPEDKEGWRELFIRIKDLERQCYLEVDRVDGKINGIMLSPSGAALIRDRLDRTRGLLSLKGVV